MKRRMTYIEKNEIEKEKESALMQYLLQYLSTIVFRAIAYC